VNAELASRLGQIAFFSGLAPNVLDGLAAASTRRTLTAGEIVFLEGEPSPGLWLVGSGRVKIVKSSPQGREHILAIIEPWEPVNAVAVFTSRPNPATAVALEPVEAWVFPRSAIIAILRIHPEFADRVIENMANHMVRLTEIVADLSLRSVIERLARLILDESVDGRLERPSWYTLPELAAQLGTVPDVVQRALGRLAADDLVEVSRREIRIKNPAALLRLLA